MRIRLFAIVGLISVLCLACAPSTASTDSATSTDSMASGVSPEQVSAGGELYAQRCAGCHGAEGEGGDRGPAHAGNPELAYASFVADRILDGYGYKKMPSYKGRFSDEEIANVATYIRNSWGNNFGSVSTAQVAARR